MRKCPLNYILPAVNAPSSPERSSWRRKRPGKIHQVEDDDGWTHVIKGPPPKAVDQAVAVTSTHSLDGPELNAKFDLFSSTWRNSTAFRLHKNYFEQNVLPVQGLDINRCVCLALGSFTTSLSVRLQHRDSGRSLSQLVALESWLDLLRTRFTFQRIVFQDPAFVESDRAFLRARGFEVVEDPAAQALITDSTFVFAPCAPAELVRWIARETRSRLWIAALPVGEEATGAYERWSLPPFPHADWHTGMAVFSSKALWT